MKPIQALRLRRSVTGAVTGADPYFSSVVFLSGFEGPHVSDWNDESSFHHTASLSASFNNIGGGFSGGKFGAGPLRFYRGSGSTATLTYADNAAFELGSGSFTMECWVAFDTAPGSTTANFLFGHYDTNSQRSWGLGVDAGNLKLLLSTNGTSATTAASGAWTPSGLTWYFVAADFDGTAYRTYAGTSGTASMIGKSTTLVTPLLNSTAPFSVGMFLASGAVNTNFVGSIDELRITKGVARYASDAGFTIPTAAFPRS